MNSKRCLPIILVSASDKATAEEFISELIDDEVERSEMRAPAEARVWRLQNKYYRAEVGLVARGDAEPPPPVAEGHVAVLSPRECETSAAAERRAYGAAAVRVLAVRSARVAGPLAAWAARARYEPVPLLAPPEPAGPFAQTAGLPRVRAALHAHPWPGHTRLDRVEPAYLDADESSSSGGEGDYDSGAEADVERAEEFARALGALGGGGGEARGDAERRERAEQLVAAFCRALGHRLDC